MDSGTEHYRRYCAGEESGLAAIIREYKDGLIFYLYGIVGDIHTAEDLAEDTFVLLGVKKPRNRETASFKTWLYTIGRNRALDWLRRRRREALPAEGLPSAELPDDAAQLEQTYLQQEEKRLLHRAMGRLSSDHRQVLWLLYFEDMSAKQAAQVMGKSVHGIETLAYRARLALKTQMKTEGFSDENQ